MYLRAQRGAEGSPHVFVRRGRIGRGATNRARQRGLQRNHSMNIDADLVEERKVRREVRKLNAWLIQKSMEHQERQEWSKTEFLRSRTTTITEKKTLLPESAFKSFDSSSIVSSIEDEIHKLTIEADVHNGNVMLQPETNKVSESDSDLLLEAKLIRTDGTLAKLASIEDCIAFPSYPKMPYLTHNYTTDSTCFTREGYETCARPQTAVS